MEAPTAECYPQETPTISPFKTHRVRLFGPLVIPAYSQVKSAVVTKLQGPTVLEPKHSLFDNYEVLRINIIHEFVCDIPFSIWLNNFSANERMSPNSTIVALGVRFPITLVSPSGPGPQALCGMVEIFSPYRARNQPLL